MSMREFFFPPIESVSSRQSVDDCVSVVNARRIVIYCKMTERLEHFMCVPSPTQPSIISSPTYISGPKSVVACLTGFRV